MTPIHPQEIRIAKKILGGARLRWFGSDQTLHMPNGEKRWISSKWLERMERHDLIRVGGIGTRFLLQDEFVLTATGQELATDKEEVAS